jgi:hypothetical protein
LPSGVRLEEKSRSALGCPVGELIGNRSKLVADLLEAEDPAPFVRGNQPIPKRRAEVEAVVEVLGLHEDVGVQQVRH